MWIKRLKMIGIIIFFLLLILWGVLLVLARTYEEKYEMGMTKDGVTFVIGYRSEVYWYDSSDVKAMAIKIDTIFDDTGVWKKIRCCVPSKYGSMSACVISKENPECDTRLKEREKTIKNYIKKLKKKRK